MRWNKSTFLWIVIAAVLIPMGIARIRLALLSTEQRIESQIVELLHALEDRKPRRVARGLSRDFVDEATGYGRRDVVDATKVVLIPDGTRYRATLDEENGLEFLSISDDPVPAVTVRVHCLMEVGDRHGNFRPWWNLEATLDLERQGGVWLVVRSRDVNHDRRPRR